MMMAQGILPGLALSEFVADLVPDAHHTMLVAVTEKRTAAEIARYVSVLQDVLGNNMKAAS